MTVRCRTLLAPLAAVAIAGVGPGQSLAAATPSRAQALAFARAVNLRAGDLPGFKAGAVSKTTASERKMSAQLASCSGGVNPSRALIERDSPDLTAASGIVQADVSSEVEVLPSAALVAKDLAAVKSARGKACLERALNKEFAAMKVKGVKFGRVTVTTTQLPAVGASGSFALRFTISATIRGAKIPYYADFLGFTLGPAEVTLSALGFAQPVPGKDELGLFSVLLRRAQAAAV